MTHDAVNHPKHYTQQPHECIVFTAHLDFCLGNAFKYIWRANDKNGLQDLHKAAWYLGYLAEQDKLPEAIGYKASINGFVRLGQCKFGGMQNKLLCGLWSLASNRHGTHEHVRLLRDELMDWIKELERDASAPAVA